MGFDNTIDNRWRPDFEGSRRRVREEEQDDQRPVYSRELAFVPARRLGRFDSYDPQTRALIEQQLRLERLPHHDDIAPRLADWHWIDAMHGPQDKQRFLEPLIHTVRRDPATHEGHLLFLLIALEPVRRGVHSRFLRARSGLEARPADADWSNRAEARMLREIEQQTLHDVTRAATVEALMRYPSPPPQRFFAWLRATIAHRALDHLRGELPQLETTPRSAPEAAAIQAALAGLQLPDAPPMREVTGARPWRDRTVLRGLYEIVGEYHAERQVRDLCRTAVGRLAPRQAEVIEAHFFAGAEIKQIAANRKVSPSTISNTKAHALSKLHDDDVFFAALEHLGVVRDHARRRTITESFPDGRLPDGRRIVIIDEAA